MSRHTQSPTTTENTAPDQTADDATIIPLIRGTDHNDALPAVDPEALLSLHMEQLRASLLVARLRAARVHYSYAQATLLIEFDSHEQAAWCFGVVSESAP